MADQAAPLVCLGVFLFLFIAGIKLNFTSILYTRVVWSVGHIKREEQEGGKEIKESKWDIGGRRMMNNKEEKIQGDNSYIPHIPHIFLRKIVFIFVCFETLVTGVDVCFKLKDTLCNKTFTFRETFVK